jgi:hypothetical protein
MRFPVPSRIVVALAALSCLAAAQARAQDFPSTNLASKTFPYVPS